MKKFTLHVMLVFALAATFPARAALDIFEALGLKKKSPSLTALTEEQLVAGLKEALLKGAEHAVTNLGRQGGFLLDSSVRIPLPESLRKIEQSLRVLRQDQVADEFVATMNRAAEMAVVQAAPVLGDAVRQMTLADARAILTSTNTAATDYFRQTSGTNLQVRFLPIVSKTTAETGVTAAYKRLLDKAGGGLGGLGSIFLKRPDLDLDAYITRKTVDGLFLKIAEEERRIREDPKARTTELLERVFGALGRGR